MALDGHAPSIFLKLNRYGVPYVSVAASVAWGVVAYSSLNRGAFQVCTLFAVYMDNPTSYLIINRFRRSCGLYRLSQRLV